jgi:hypothetical protein
MEHNNWSKQELVAYILLYIANIDLKESNSERDFIMSRIDRELFDNIYKEFNNDNDYQSINKITTGVKFHNYDNHNLEELFAEMKLMAFADGDYDQMEQSVYNYLKKILQN